MRFRSGLLQSWRELTLPARGGVALLGAGGVADVWTHWGIAETLETATGWQTAAHQVVLAGMTEPNQIWGWDLSWIKVLGSFWYLIRIIDLYSRKIVGYAVRPQATSQDVKDVFDKALANEGLLAMDSPMPRSLSDRGSQMRSKSIRRFFADLGITQLFARPHTPADNAEIESFFATVKGERLYKMSYDDPMKMINDDPMKMINDVDSFVVFYNADRLHQGIGFVTPNEKHDESWEAILQARKVGMKQAQEHRLAVNRRCRSGSDAD